jgi:hypothetical protein
MSTDTYPYRYNFDAHMIQHASHRGQVAVTRDNSTRIGVLITWRPRRKGTTSRRYVARVDFGGQLETVRLSQFTVVPA